MPSDPPTPAQPSDPTTIDADLFCPQCGYNLRGLTVDRCPECGKQFDLANLMVSRIPWPQRGEIGAFRAYWRTVWLVTSRTSRFCDELIHPAPYKDAQRFRWITILHAYLAVLAATIAIYVYPSLWYPRSDLLKQGYGEIWPVVVFDGALLLVLAAITGVPSYFLQSRTVPVEQENRAIAMSYYASAPLAWIPLMFLLITSVFWVELVFDSIEDAQYLLALCAATAVLLGLLMSPLLPGIWLGGLLGLARRTLRSRPWRIWVMGLLLPIVWIALAVLIPGSMILSVAYVVLVFGSLR